MIRVAGLEISAVLFDLDNTLVDRAKAVHNLGTTLFANVEMSGPSFNEDEFVERFVQIDAGGSIPDKQHQMATVIRELSIIDTSDSDMKLWWDREYPKAFELENSTRRVLTQLSRTGTPWGIVTNGSPLQMAVIKAIGLDELTETVVVSSVVGLRKPDYKIFELAVNLLDGGEQLELSEVLFVGDNPAADIGGASKSGMKTVWVSRGEKWPAGEPLPDAVVESVGDLLELIDDI